MSLPPRGGFQLAWDAPEPQPSLPSLGSLQPPGSGGKAGGYGVWAGKLSSGLSG